MSNVIKFPKHRRARCSGEDCNGACNYCNLFCCAVCGGAEASLPKECPGERMDVLTEAAVQCGGMDFYRGEWWYSGYSAEEVV